MLDKQHIAAQTQFKRIQIQRLGVLQRPTLLTYKKSADPKKREKEFNAQIDYHTANMKESARSLSKVQRLSIDRRLLKPTTNERNSRVSKSTTGLSHDQIRITDFKQLHKIGQGSYSTVKIFSKDGCKYACKIFKKPLTPQVLENVKNEIEVLKKVSHQNIVKLQYTFEDTNHLYIVLEFVEGKTLASLLKKSLSQQQIKAIARQLLSAIGYLHVNNIAHRDLKLDNIMIDQAHNNRVVLIDFGFATACQKKLKMFCGTPSYMCPEIVKRSWYSGIKADMWALGVILYRMVTGNFPFRGTSEMEVFGKICKSKYDESKLSGDQSMLLKNLLCKLEIDRFKCPQVISCTWLTEEPPKDPEPIIEPQQVVQQTNEPLF